MEIREIKNKTEWESFFQLVKEKSFLQSWAWGEFQLSVNNKIWRLGVVDQDKLVAVVLLVSIKAKRGNFLLIQHGPSFDSSIDINKVLPFLLVELKKIAKQEGSSFIRLAPLLIRNEANNKLFQDLGFRLSPMHASAYEATWKLDISLEEEELLKNMRKTTRYLIRQAEKNTDIKIDKSDSLEDLAIYQKLNAAVASRQKFVPFSNNYIKKEFEVFSQEKNVLWLFGKYQDEIVAGALVVFWQGIAFYHQAASLGKFAKLSIPYLLQWEAIKEAKRRNCKLYDFWGYIDPQKEKRHPWAGPTLFKMGFGGKSYEYVKTQDLPLSYKYWLTFVFEKIRKIKRGL